MGSSGLTFESTWTTVVGLMTVIRVPLALRKSTGTCKSLPGTLLTRDARLLPRCSRPVSTWLRIWFRTVMNAATEASATLAPTATITRAVIRVRKLTCDSARVTLSRNRA